MVRIKDRIRIIIMVKTHIFDKKLIIFADILFCCYMFSFFLSAQGSENLMKSASFLSSLCHFFLGSILLFMSFKFFSGAKNYKNRLHFVLAAVSALYIIFIMMVRNLEHLLFIGKQQNYIRPLSVRQFLLADLTRSRWMYFSVWIFMNFLILILRVISSHKMLISRKIRKMLVSSDLQIVINNDCRDLIMGGIEIQKVSARIKDGSNLFISGALSAKNTATENITGPFEVRCDLENCDGNILFSFSDPGVKTLGQNKTETFFMSVYHFDRFFDPIELTRAVLYIRLG